MESGSAVGGTRWRVGRRELMGTAVKVAVALALPWRAEASATARRLRMSNTHTDERIDVEYFEHGALVPDALAAIGRFLRDVRTGEVHRIDPAVLDIAWSLARAVGQPLGTFEIVSGYRSPATNAMLHERSRGVAVHSLHVEGRAIDLRLSGVRTDRLRDAALALARGGVGYYEASDFVHVDSGRVRRW